MNYCEFDYDNIPIKAYAMLEVSNKWGYDQWDSFNKIVIKESNWIHTAQNPISSAYGLCQTMMSLHETTENFITDPKTQINWCIDYIRKTYDTPSKAVTFHKENNWF